MAEKETKRVDKAVNEQKVIVVLRTDTADSAFRIAEAVSAAGLSLIDIPVTVPGVFEVIAECSRHEGLMVGAGSVTTMNEVADAIDRGASFIVCPHHDRAIIDYCRDNGVFVAAGGLTPTEVMVAHLAGVDLITVYPVHLMGGAEYTRRLLRPMPFLKMMPVGGIGVSQAAEHLKEGAVAVGVTSAIIDPDALAAKDYDSIRENAKAFLNAIVKSSRKN